MNEEAVGQTEHAAESVSIAKEQLMQLQRMASIGAVASSVAHEFNNILTTILNHAKIGPRAADREGVERSFEKILSAARRAAKITTGVLALSRNRVARMESTDPVLMLEEVLAVLEKDLSKHQVRIEKEFDAVPAVPMVAAQIEQVVMNLVINARQAMPSGGTLKLSLHHNAETDMVEISVRDSGVGIEPENVSRIFEPFYSTKDGPDVSGHGGSGLGLSICREIIERHHGRIRVESLVGRGTTFTIKLPVHQPSERGLAA